MEEATTRRGGVMGFCDTVTNQSGNINACRMRKTGDPLSAVRSPLWSISVTAVVVVLIFEVGWVEGRDGTRASPGATGT